ncbi:TetR/AcrR family transcriptional regulator C-terminal domain-containing protein [Glutamicibacter endophyticus]|uniref:TetR/AcrR family transcriptional regulator C-terminal domain-containing protein n=1 Tax=Glutamicibacter endophyticus TaxID=1522174 RepID=UPI003AF0A097
MARPSSPLITREAIAEAAIGLIDRAGDFSMPKLAGALGVRQSSLYNHVNGREGVIELVRTRCIEDLVVPNYQDLPWREALRALIQAYWHSLAAHPNLVPLLIRQTVSSEVVIDYYARIIEVLLRAGLGEERAVHMISVIDDFVLGAALDVGSPEVAWSINAERYPRFARALQLMPNREERASDAFDFGLDLILEGLARHLPTPSERTH